MFQVFEGIYPHLRQSKHHVTTSQTCKQKDGLQYFAVFKNVIWTTLKSTAGKQE